MRVRLPDRRPCETLDLEFGGNRYSVAIGYHPDGRSAEVFGAGAKIGSNMDGLLDDTAVLISLLLQFGAEPAQIAASMGRLGVELCDAGLNVVFCHHAVGLIPRP